ncbi:MAG: hypothetical protein GX270_14550 [Clostridiaceae bacterium]|nr:hypothetical protein [Clostridiaceae bacterium]
MRCKDLKVVNLNITEDNYQYKALFRLCTEDSCMDIDMENLSDNAVLEEIKKTFSLEESIEEINSIITEKVMEASKIESRIKEGKDVSIENKDNKTQRGIDSLSTS